ncbi:response regulator transcription factor [Pseudoduganella violacea]|uniref:FixJ family two-component response regulator n=1 Tax=Pseudoduganella violacea TaxID=1715466 RepID=A0A7W5FUT5_9BURK|nr:response regulator [Pseudoduganella violacea]MBB3119513.1 FixJ family two-component response regulator [Pseudoduganella violacea]
MDTSTPWVAIVDDDDMVRRAVLRLLRSAGIAARSYASGTELLADMARQQPCCVILDLHMPLMDGFTLQARLAQTAPHIATVVVTGQHSPQAQQQAMRYPPQAYLTKPMDERQLLDVVAAALASRSPT